MPLLLSAADVHAALPMAVAVDVLEEGFRRFAAGAFTMPQRLVMPHPDGILAVMALLLEVARRGHRLVLSTHSQLILDVLWSMRQLKGDPDGDRKLVRILGLEDTHFTRLFARAALAKEQSFRKGERIYELGDPGDALYVILEGAVRGEDRKGEEVLSLGAKEAFGEVSLLDGSPRPTSVTALEDSRLLVIDRRDFLDLISDRPELLKGVFRAAMRQYAYILQEPRRNTGEVPKATPPGET